MLQVLDFAHVFIAEPLRTFGRHAPKDRSGKPSMSAFRVPSREERGKNKLGDVMACGCLDVADGDAHSGRFLDTPLDEVCNRSRQVLREWMRAHIEIDPFRQECRWCGMLRTIRHAAARKSDAARAIASGLPTTGLRSATTNPAADRRTVAVAASA
jgi:hypothetical protein